MVIAIFCSYHSGSASLSVDLIETIRSGDSAGVAHILSESPEQILLRDEAGRMPVHIVSESGHINILQLLVQSGGSVDSVDFEDRTPLHYAAKSGTREMVEILINDGANISARDRNGRTPLMDAVLNGRRETAQVLMNHGTPVDVPDDSRSEMICSAAELGFATLVDSLISGCDETDLMDSSGGTLLHSAAAGGLCSLASALIDGGASLIHRNIYGHTPLHCAASHGHADMIDLLLARGAYIDARDSAGFTPLHYAQAFKHDAVTRLLVLRGADVSGGRFRALSGTYVSQDIPSRIPELFAPGIISSPADEAGGIWISSSGDELYFSRNSMKNTKRSIFMMKYVNGRWSQPRQIIFTSNICHDCSPALSHDGKRLFFCSCRLDDANTDTMARVWMSERISGGWTQPKPLGDALAHIPSEGGIALSSRDCVYFPARRTDGIGSCDIYLSCHTEEGYIEAENLGSSINTPYGECCSYVDPGERFLIFASDRPGGFGSWDLYISTRLEDGSWSEAINMGDEINTSADERNATLSPDGSVLFFLSNRNGNLDYYWVHAEVLEVFPEEAS